MTRTTRPTHQIVAGCVYHVRALGAVRVLDVDANPHARVWVVEVQQPDRDHLLDRADLRSVVVPEAK